MRFCLLRPEDVIYQWETLAALFENAVAQGRGELATSDIRQLVLSGRMFVFALVDANDTPVLAVTAEFQQYPRKVVLIVGFGAGDHAATHRERIWEVLTDFARRGGATAVQSFVQNPAMVRYHERFFGAERAYTVMERSL